MKKFWDINCRDPQKAGRRLLICLMGAIVFAIHSSGYPALSFAQKEVTSSTYRKQERDRRSKIYEKHEYKRYTYKPFVQTKAPGTALITLAPPAGKVLFRKYLADSHLGLRFYELRTCIRCHPKQARNLHRIRAKITCRQCHGEDPIAGNSHYNSLMHPRRRYVLVCAKCHEGSNPSFATYVVHEPIPIAKTTQKTFPLLFYCVWAMVAIAVGTFAAFLPHTFLWGLREFSSGAALSGFKDLQAKKEGLVKKRRQNEKD